MLGPSHKPASDTYRNPLSRLVPLARNGDAEAGNAICEQIHSYLQWAANREFDERLRRKLNESDIVQQTMTRAVSGLGGFRGKTSKEFYAWLNRILKNEIQVARRDLHRKKRDLRREQSLAPPNDCIDRHALTDPNPTPCTQAIRAERIRQLQLILQRLPEKMAEVIRLRSLEARPLKEVADIMNQSYDVTNKLWRRAIARFQSEMIAVGHESGLQ